ncbi:MAG: PspC domain-containing protein [Mangrovibacterium sp.]
MKRRLTKTYDRVLTGVCGGIAEYINPEMDPLIIRIIWLIFSCFNPVLILVYFILAVVMPRPELLRPNSQAQA